MPTPVQFMNQYRNLQVPITFGDTSSGVATQPRTVHHVIQIRKYFMMNWTVGTEQRNDYNAVMAGSTKDAWFRAYIDAIQTAAMGKGAPADYIAALEWAVLGNKIRQIQTPSPGQPAITQSQLQQFCDDHLGIDCSGFVTNYLIANGKKPNDHSTKRNTGASSYYSAARAVNNILNIQQGDILVWMNGNNVKVGPGHVAVVESFQAMTRADSQGTLRIVEATGNAAANPKLLDSLCTVQRIIDRGTNGAPVLMLELLRHGQSTGNRVSIMRY